MPAPVRWGAGAAVCLLAVLAGTCKVGDVTNPPPPRAKLAVSPLGVVDSARVGSVARHVARIDVSNAGDGSLSWTAQRMDGSAWLAVSPSSGTAPASASVTLDPTALTMGVYRDTLVLSADGVPNSPLLVPIQFTVQPCASVALGPAPTPVQVDDSLSTSDCGAPHRAARFTRLYSFRAAANDSITLTLASAAFDAYLVLDSSTAAGAPPLAENDSCAGGRDACLVYLRLPLAGSYAVEATTASAGETGAYHLSLTRPRAPNPADSLRQLRGDSATALAVGGTIDQATVVLGGVVSDPDAGDTLRLEVEVGALGSAFTGAPTAASAPVANGRRALVAVSGLSNGTSYHWQARALDQTGRRSAWVAFGANPETAADFSVAIPPSAATSTLAVSPRSIGAGTGSAAITVTARDAGGSPVSGATVVLAATGSGNTITQPTGATDANGVAVGAVRSSVAEDKTVSATINGIAVTQTGTLTVTAGGPSASQSQVIATPATFVAGSGTATITVTVKDGLGNGVSGVPVTLSATGSGNTLTQPAGPTDANGVATGTLSSTVAQAKTISATAGGVALTTQPTVAVTPAAANNVSFVVQPSAAVAGASITPAVQVEIRDQYSNRVTTATNGVTLDIGTNPGNGTLTGGAPAVTPVNGVASFAGLSIDKAGTGYTLFAASTNLVGQVSSAFNIVNGTPTTVALSGGNAQSDTIGATLAIPYSVKVTDADNNPVGGTTVTWAVTAGGGSVTPTSVTSPTGIATATRVLGTAAAPQGASATVSGLSGSPVSFTATATHGNATTLALNGGDAQTGAVNATLPVPYTVLVTDRAGNPVGGTTVTWAVTGGGAITPSSATATTGIASATRVLGPTAGTQGATATVTGLAGSPVSFTATATAGGAAKLMITTEPAASVASGAALSTQPVVQLRDANNNNVPQAGTLVTATVAVGPAGATLASATATTGPTGAATFSGLAISGTVGTYQLQMATGALPPDTTVAITLTAGAAARLALTTQPSGSVQNAIAFPQQPIVQLQDASGNNVAQAGGAVTPAIATGGGTLSPMAAVQTNGSGAALFSGLAITGTTGARTLTFTSGTLTAVTSTPVTVTAGAATQIAVSSGNNQAATAGTAVATAPAVIVRDVSGNPVAGSAVTFAVTGTSNGSITGANQTTAASGSAQVTSWTLGTQAKPDTLTATAPGLTGSPVTFVDTAQVGAAAHIAKFSGDAVGPVNTPTVHDVVITDANNNPVPGVTVTWAAQGGGSVSPATSVSDAGGHAQATRMLGTTPGTETTTATAALTGGPTTVTFTITVQAAGASQIAANGGDAQTDTVGRTLPTSISVIVKDAFANPVSGVTITWSIVHGGGSVNPSTSVTNAGGIASTSWTLGTVTSPADNTQLAQASGVASPVGFAATAVPAAVNAGQSSVTATSPITAGGVASSITVTARDQYGNLIAGKSITLAATGTGNTVTNPSAPTDANGMATGSLSSTKAETKIITATVGTVSIAQQPTVAVNPAVASNLNFVVQPAASTTAGATMTPAVQVEIRDQFANRVSTATNGVALVMANNPGGGTLTGGGTVPAVTGVATFAGLSIDKAGTGYTLSAASTGLTAQTSSAFTITTGAAAAIAATSPTSQTATAGTAVSSPPSVIVRDANGNPVAGVAVTFALAAGNGTLTGGSQTTNAGGVATVGGWTLSPTAGTNTMTASSGTLSGGPVTFTATGTAGAASSIAVNAGNGQSATAGSPVATPPSIIVKDVNGNVVTGVAVTFAIGSGGGTVSPAIPVATGTDGVATVTSWTLGPTAGTNTLTATSGTLSGSPVTFTATGTPGAAATVGANSPTSQTATAGTAVSSPPSVIVKDANGNPVAGVAVMFAVAAGGGAVNPTTAVATSGSGLAAVTSWTLGITAGSNTLTASAAGLGGSPVVFNATGSPGAATQLTITTPPSGAGQAGVPLAQQPVVQLRDAYGNPVSQAGVTVSATAAGATLAGASVLTDANGTASFTALAIGGLAANYTLQFTSGALPPVSASATTVAAGPASLLSKQAGDNQTAQVGTAVAVVPAALVTDAFSNPVAGVAVTFAVATGRGVVNPTTAIATSGSGIAAVTSWTLGTTAGANTLTATAPGLAGNPLTFSASGTAGAPSGATSQISASPASLMASNGTDQATITVTVLDANSNPVSGASVALLASGGGNTLTQPAGLTDASGHAVGTLSSVSVGVKTITATVDGTTPLTASAGVTVTPGPAARLVYQVQPSLATAGQPISPAVQVGVQDGFGNAATGYAGTVTVAIAAGTGTSGAALLGSPSVTASGGVATFSNVSVDSAGTGYQLAASGLGLTGATSTSFNIVAGPAASLSFTGQPSSIATGALMAPVVQVTARDAVGNRATSFTGAVTLALLGTNPNAGKLYGRTTQSAVAGTAAFSDLTLDSAATGYTLQASAGSLGGTSGPFSVAAAPSVVFIGAGDIADGSLRQVATNALLQANPTATVFALGDQAYPNGALSDYQTLYDPSWGQQKARTRPTPGNHEYLTPGAAGYWQYFTPTVSIGDSGKFYYSYDLGTWHIISLNGEISTSAGSAQELWLKADLAASTKTCTIAYIHRPRYSAGHHGSNGYMQPLWQDLYNAGAEIYLAGHNHDYERFAPQNADSVADSLRGIREFVVGTGGATAEAWSVTPPILNEEVWANPVYGVLKLTLYTSTYTWEFLPVAGETFTDQGSGSCH